MQYIDFLSFALMATIVGVTAVPLPESAQASERCPSTSVKAEQSTILGWQLAGALTNLDQTCSQLQNGELQKWAEIGLDTTKVQTAVCQGDASSPPISLSAPSRPSGSNSTAEPLPNIVTANSVIMKTYLTSSFENSDATTFGYLCDSLSSDQVSGFFLDDVSIINATCTLGGGQIRPKAFTPLDGAVVNRTAVQEFEEAQSKIFANLYAASASSDSDLESLCTASSSEPAQTAYATLQLHAACVSGTVCSIKEPISVEQAEQALKSWTTKSFLAFILNISGTSGYKRFLCDELSVDKMDALGLDGQAAKEGVCKAAEDEGNGLGGLVNTVLESLSP